jgi:hypothetical protein
MSSLGGLRLSERRWEVCIKQVTIQPGLILELTMPAQRILVRSGDTNVSGKVTIKKEEGQ